MTAAKIKLRIADAKDNLLETVLLKSEKGTIEVPENSLISKGKYFVKGDKEYVEFKQMVRRSAQRKYNGNVGITFSKYDEREKKNYFSKFFSL